MQFPILNRPLVERLEAAEAECLTDRMNAIRERPGNPEGVEVIGFGGATAFYAKTMPWSWFNTVKRLGAEDIGRLDEILLFYRERNRPCQFELIPSRTTPELMDALAERGFCQTGFHTTLYGVPDMEGTELPAELSIRELQEDEFELYGELHCVGSGMSADGRLYVAANNRVLYNRPGWRFFIGFVDGQPAGVGVMHMREGIASFTFAATVPGYRKRGLQSALLRRRIREAAIHGCDLLVSQAAYASTSQNNMERAGMRVAYTRATWSERKR
ncbi:GNAT family N-acetyltransferase [Paenibacillus sp. MBLB4367]|uniref:GNAT family N-acetyltransferase n=1 Tax=Paenibacillus sp. MBLB4367 TaxID=3384767 RepID=UPI003908342A